MFAVIKVARDDISFWVVRVRPVQATLASIRNSYNLTREVATKDITLRWCLHRVANYRLGTKGKPIHLGRGLGSPSQLEFFKHNWEMPSDHGLRIYQYFDVSDLWGMCFVPRLIPEGGKKRSPLVVHLLGNVFSKLIRSIQKWKIIKS